MREPDEAWCWEAVARTTCAACLDRHDDNHGQGRVPARAADCPLRTSFAVVRDVVRGIHSKTMDAYVAAGTLRGDRGECALYAYLPLTVKAMEEALPA